MVSERRAISVDSVEINGERGRKKEIEKEIQRRLSCQQTYTGDRVVNLSLFSVYLLGKKNSLRIQLRREVEIREGKA